MKVDFYILSGGGESGHTRYTCRLAEKAYKLKHRIYIHVNNGVEAQQLDELLWTFRQDSFVPHELCADPLSESKPESPIIIGYNNVAPDGYGMLINLSQGIPKFYKQFDRVAEVVADADTLRQISREHFRFYRDQGITPDTHQISL
ncbi:MAG: DNA polymerase III subunit chi [Gammaproteobacteria bacterium]|nr:DNA polymerase III subunit chi [Gammaproteobacteria bacterium]PCH62189.1 MAG: DNA polymerase III subunit chi [Gammaproteobacteria bacterium]PCH63306.1 MAG: DNA polymerase III subunit chi [Gammaproteobacteria bacterium]